MNDIKVPSHLQKSPEFGVKAVSGGLITPQSSKDFEPEPSDKIKVKFEKFVQLVATHDFEGVLKKYADDDVIINSNLLTDLANAHEEIESHPNRIPIWIISGIIIGVIVTYLLLRF